MADETIYGCVNPDRTITIRQGICFYPTCVIRDPEDEHFGMIAVTILTDYCNDTFYGCIDWDNNGKFEILIPDYCCCIAEDDCCICQVEGYEQPYQVLASVGSLQNCNCIEGSGDAYGGLCPPRTFAGSIERIGDIAGAVNGVEIVLTRVSGFPCRYQGALSVDPVGFKVYTSVDCGAGYYTEGIGTTVYYILIIREGHTSTLGVVIAPAGLCRGSMILEGNKVFSGLMDTTYHCVHGSYQRNIDECANGSLTSGGGGYIFEWPL